MSVVIETTIGDLTIDLFTEERPIACLNFVKLCKLKYYNFNLFHTIEQGFIAQTGDPTGAGDGGSSIWGVVEGQHKRFFEAESLPKIHHTSAGLVSLVGAGKHLVGSQFFITLGENLSSLDGQHCVIGEVVEGHDVLRKLNEAIVDENLRPYQDIRITHMVILEDPFPDPRGFREPSRSPSPSAERLKNGRIAADEDIDDTEGKSMEEIQEMLAEREAKARATILEIVGDLPDAEMAPPENVLFVCKLNPVTTDDDLEIIFSRFGKVKGCEVIRDRKSGDSLQYAFVEFEDQKSCEAAYFKMDNVLIDDRRIHVDFSQSVSKVKWRGKGRGVEGNSKGLDFNNLRDKVDKNQRIERDFKTYRNYKDVARCSNRSSRSRSREHNKSFARNTSRQEPEKQRRRSRSRSKNRSLGNHGTVRESNRDHLAKLKEKYRKRSRSHRLERGSHKKESAHKKYGQGYSPERYPRRRDEDEKCYQSIGAERNVSRGRSQHERIVERNGGHKMTSRESNTHKKKQKRRAKKSKREIDSSDDSSSDSDSDSSSENSETTNSSESDISIEKKKLKKFKKHKNKFKKKQSKKHRK